MLSVETLNFALLRFFLSLFLFLLGVLLDVGFELSDPENKLVQVKEGRNSALTLQQ
jgi:hypothetical protein